MVSSGIHPLPNPHLTPIKVPPLLCKDPATLPSPPRPLSYLPLSSIMEIAWQTLPRTISTLYDVNQAGKAWAMIALGERKGLAYLWHFNSSTHMSSGVIDLELFCKAVYSHMRGDLRLQHLPSVVWRSSFWVTKAIFHAFTGVGFSENFVRRQLESTAHVLGKISCMTSLLPMICIATGIG